MMILRQKSKAITFEAFHVFKVFVANPHQKPEIYSVLWKNRTKLIGFLTTFQETERQDDNQFIHEKNLLIEKLRSMEKTPEEYAEWYEQKQSRGGRSGRTKRAARGT